MNTQYDRLLYAAKAIKGWNSASKLADMLTLKGYPVIPQGISNWKTRGLSYEAIVKCSRIIGCDLVWLETGEGSPFGTKDGHPASPPHEAEQIADSLSPEQLTVWLEIGRMLATNRSNP